MTGQFMDVLSAAAPYACMAIAGACVAVTLRNAARPARDPAQSVFGHWPETGTPPSRKTPGPIGKAADNAATAVSLGLAAGIAAGEVLFRLFPEGLP